QIHQSADRLGAIPIGGLIEVLPVSPATFMGLVGLVEIVAGILVWTKTRIGAYVVSAWLTAIALSLIFSWNYVDVAVRDLVMALAALCLAWLSPKDSGKAHP